MVPMPCSVLQPTDKGVYTVALMPIIRRLIQERARSWWGGNRAMICVLALCLLCRANITRLREWVEKVDDVLGSRCG